MHPFSTKILALGFVFAIFMSCSPEHRGATTLPTPETFQDFTLSDQNGNPFTFSSLRGKPVVVSFLFTNCDDVCSYLSVKLKDAQDRLGSEKDKVELVVISTDPEGDTQEAIAAYTTAMGMEGRWHYLRGSREQMEAVWKIFGVAVAKITKEEAQMSHMASEKLGHDLETPGAHTLPTEGLSKSQQDLAAKLITLFAKAEYEISHTAPYWVLDKEGRKVSVLGPQVTPQEIEAEIRKQL